MEAANSSTFGGSTDPGRPDYTCPAYLEMSPRWQRVTDVRGATEVIRAKKETYLPKFEAETNTDWQGRVDMTFVDDHYATTIVEHVGLVLAEPPKLGDDVPPALAELCEDIDGEGNHIEVFAESVLDAALDLGHAVIFTDYPVTDSVKTLADQRRAKVRPYATLYRASDVLSWDTAVVGGVRTLTRIMFRESTTVAEGAFGVKPSMRLREIRQEVFYDEITQRATGLGAITWKAWVKQGDEWTPAGEGTITGPEHICARVVYGGEKLGVLHTKPHLNGLSWSNIEHTQVKSDMGSVMHKCNVPTPYFVGRTRQGDNDTIQMGMGIDLGPGGSAGVLEPSGNAIGATQQRLKDIEGRMQRQGATSADLGGKQMTATEASMVAKQRNAKLRKAARSLQDALEGMLADMAAFLNLPDGGSVTVTKDFTGQEIDPAYLTVLVTAYREGALPLSDLLHALEKGRLPDDFAEQDAALRLIADEMARRDAQEAEAKKIAAQPPGVPAAEPVPEDIAA